MTSVIILAQGRQTRFKSLDHPKCRIKVGVETLLARTLRLVAEIAWGVKTDRTYGPIVVSQREATLGLAVMRLELNEPGYCVLDGLFQTRDLWSKDGRTIILFGDVCYSRACIRRVFEEPQAIQFFGSPDLSRSTGELYALAFSYPMNPMIAELIDAMPCRKIEHTVAQPGHLRNLLWAIQAKYEMQITTPELGLCTVIEDFTTDFDTDEDLKQIPELVALIKEEREC